MRFVCNLIKTHDGLIAYATHGQDVNAVIAKLNSGAYVIGEPVSVSFAFKSQVISKEDVIGTEADGVYELGLFDKLWRLLKIGNQYDV